MHAEGFFSLRESVHEGLVLSILTFVFLICIVCSSSGKVSEGILASQAAVEH